MVFWGCFSHVIDDCPYLITMFRKMLNWTTVERERERMCMYILCEKEGQCVTWQTQIRY